MKILHLWLGDAPNAGGGGAGSMFRLSRALRDAGADSRILCERKTTTADWVHTKPRPNLLERGLKQITSRLGLNDIHRISSHWLHRNPHVQAADVLHFHGIHSGFFSYLALPALSARKPVVFTLRDMWPLTGHCAVPMDCERWRTGCGSCPYLDAYPPVKRDATAVEWRLKDRSYSRSELTIVALSEWIAKQARDSMLQRFPIHTIPNGVDTGVYRPRGRQECRQALGIAPDRPVVMFMATNLNSRHKGGDLLAEALRRLPADLKRNVLCTVVGSGGSRLLEDTGIDYLDLGYVRSEHLQAAAYSAADVYVSPSRAEAFGQTILESMSCGTPVVSFDLGPMPELVRHDSTGFVARPEDASALGREMARLLRERDTRDRLGRTAREVAIEEYSVELEARRHLTMYRQILNGSVIPAPNAEETLPRRSSALDPAGTGRDTASRRAMTS